MSCGVTAGDFGGKLEIRILCLEQRTALKDRSSGPLRAIPGRMGPACAPLPLKAEREETLCVQDEGLGEALMTTRPRASCRHVCRTVPHRWLRTHQHPPAQLVQDNSPGMRVGGREAITLAGAMRGGLCRPQGPAEPDLASPRGMLGRAGLGFLLLRVGSDRDNTAW